MAEHLAVLAKGGGLAALRPNVSEGLESDFAAPCIKVSFGPNTSIILTLRRSHCDWRIRGPGPSGDAPSTARWAEASRVVREGGTAAGGASAPPHEPFVKPWGVIPTGRSHQ